MTAQWCLVWSSKVFSARGFVETKTHKNWMKVVHRNCIFIPLPVPRYKALLFSDTFLVLQRRNLNTFGWFDLAESYMIASLSVHNQSSCFCKSFFFASHLWKLSTDNSVELRHPSYKRRRQYRLDISIANDSLSISCRCSLTMYEVECHIGDSTRVRPVCCCVVGD